MGNVVHPFRSTETSRQLADAMVLNASAGVRLGLDLRARLGVIRRRFAIFISTLVACLLLGAVITIRAPRVYRAVATLHIDVNTPEMLSGVKEFYDIGASYWASKEYYETQYQVMQSRPVADRVVQALGLGNDILLAAVRALPPADWQEKMAHDGVGPVGSSLRAKLHLLGLEGANREGLLALLPDFDAARAIAGRIRVNPVHHSRLVNISIEDTDAQVAALLANAVADAYIETNLDQKLDATRSAVTWLMAQSLELKVKLEASEAALHSFRKQNSILSVSLQEHQTIIAQTLAQLSQQLSLARAQGFTLRARARHAAAQKPSDTWTDEAESAYLSKVRATHFDLQQEEDDLRGNYTPAHPKLASMQQRLVHVEGALSSEVARLNQRLQAQYAQNRETQAALEGEMERVKIEAQELNAKEIEYVRLKRDYDTHLGLYDLVLKREKEASISQMLKLNNVRKLEAAVAPRRPIRPNVQLNVASALMLGFFFSVALACLVDHLDNHVKSQDQVEQMIGLPFFGIVPRIKGLSDAALEKRDLYILHNPRSVVAECWKAIRTNLVFIAPDRPLRTLLVCSHGPREGKSTTAINLAVTMAMLGSRTLLVDADMRRPRLHKTFGLSNDRGLSNLIVGETTVARAVGASGIERLDVLPCGPLPPNPAELLHTERFGALLESLSKTYDRIIFDSPPVGAVSDALVLSSFVEGVVLVLHAGRSSWQNALRTRMRFETVNRPILGVVLNNIDLDRYSGREYYYYMESEPVQVRHA